jgi:hypothetical protein
VDRACDEYNWFLEAEGAKNGNDKPKCSISFDEIHEQNLFRKMALDLINNKKVEQQKSA